MLGCFAEQIFWSDKRRPISHKKGTCNLRKRYRNINKSDNFSVISHVGRFSRFFLGLSAVFTVGEVVFCVMVLYIYLYYNILYYRRMWYILLLLLLY